MPMITMMPTFHRNTCRINFRDKNSIIPGKAAMKKPSEQGWISGGKRRIQIRAASNKNCFCGKIREWLRKKRHRQGEQCACFSRALVRTALFNVPLRLLRSGLHFQSMRSEAYFWRTPQRRMMQRNAVYGLFTKPLKKGAPGQSTPFPEEGRPVAFLVCFAAG